MPTIAQISDLHLQSAVPARQVQVEPILKAINERKPDLVVISGDVTDDGWDSIEELKWAKVWLEERINGEWFAVPGNHDVGNFVTQKSGPVTEAKVKAWESVFGYNNGATLTFLLSGETGGVWHIHGYNSMVYGSGNKYEQLQNVWLAKQASIHIPLNRRITSYRVVFVHSPFFITDSTESRQTATDYWLGPSEARLENYHAQLRMTPQLIASGHVHQTRLTEVDGIHIAWAPPASGTWVHAPGLPNPPMPEKTGFLLHHLGDDGSVRSELVECAPMLKLYYHNP